MLIGSQLPVPQGASRGGGCTGPFGPSGCGTVTLSRACGGSGVGRGCGRRAGGL